MTISTGYLIFYSIFLLAGAYFGFKAGSKVSLIMGLISSLLAFAGVMMLHVSAQGAKIFLVVLTVMLSLVFLKRLIVTKKFMPSGMLIIFSIIAILASITLP